MIKLKEMTVLDFNTYLTHAIDDYAKDKIEAGTWSSTEALQLSEESFAKLLPNGIKTKNNYLFNIVSDNNQKVGILWIYIHREITQKIFIYDFEINESNRQKGYGRETLTELSKFAKDNNISQIDLHVFAHNTTAIHLYETSGFKPTDISMTKYL